MLQNHPAPESRTLPQHITDEHNGLSYTLHGDYYFPDLELPEQQPIGKWGRLHLRHLESTFPKASAHGSTECLSAHCR